MIAILKQPLAQFLVIGACIYAAYAMFGRPDEETAERTILISDERIKSLAEMWEMRWNRPPTDTELVGLVREWLREGILYRESVAMGLDVDDHIIRRRLAQKLEFLTNDLIQMQEPSDDALQAFFQENLERFQEPDLVTFTQVFFNPDARGNATLDDAAKALERLRAAGEPNAAELKEGDGSLLQSHFPEVSEKYIRRQMGSGFAEKVMQLEPDAWHGPVLSGFGSHLVYVHKFEEAEPPELASVRDSVLSEWKRAQTENFNEEFLEDLKSRYDIVIEASDVFVDQVLQGAGTDGKVEIPDGAPAS